MSCAFRRSLESMACMTHAATNMGNVSERNLATQGYRMDFFLRYGNVADAAQFLEMYGRVPCPANPGGQAADDVAQPRQRAVSGELQALQNLRLGDTAKPRSQRAHQKYPGDKCASQPAPKTKRPAVPFDDSSAPIKRS